ncbi:MAG: lysophospholipid acyltransferase family protein [Thermodesulfobacteriota bacterium]|nr:lysophospholipid acyltransferase family protein [Thermodesulfobacteriota bacterium]
MALTIRTRLLIFVIAWAYKLWHWSLRPVVHGWEESARARSNGRRIVFAVWHNELFMLSGMRQAQNFLTIVSQSKDGDLAAGVLERLGYVTVRGSSSKGGVKALVAAYRTMRERDLSAVVTVDGPRGPRHKVKDGVVFLAQKTEALVVPVRAFPTRAKIFERAWDKFILPLPGTRFQAFFGTPYEVTKEKLRGDVLAREVKILEEKLGTLGRVA